jgi:aminotransferase
VGYTIAAPPLTAAIRKVHDFLTVGAAAPLQAAGAVAMRFPDAYFSRLAAEYQERRDFLVPALREAGFYPYVPRGAYYVMCGIEDFAYTDDVAFATELVREIGLAVVPGSSFYSRASSGSQQVRFAFPKRMATLEAAATRLESLRARV